MGGERRLRVGTGQGPSTAATGSGDDGDTGRPGGGEPEGIRGLKSKLDRAKAGDEPALRQLREIFDERPELWRWLGDSSRHATESWIGAITGKDLGLGEALRRRAAELRLELAGPSPSVVLGMLADRVIICWLHLEWAEVAATSGADAPVAQSRFLESRIDHSQKRHLAALKGLSAYQRVEASKGRRLARKLAEAERSRRMDAAGPADVPTSCGGEGDVEGASQPSASGSVCSPEPGRHVIRMDHEARLGEDRRTPSLDDE